MLKTQTKTLRAAVVGAALGFALGAAPMVGAQNVPETTTRTTTADDDGADWGWIGLLGLAGLAGLMRRERHAHAPYQQPAATRP